jgi:phage baseplate assembly protein W
MAHYEECVRQAIWMILGTARGERMMRPNFGCGIHDLVFATNSVDTAGRIATEVRQALIQWEPRIDIVNVTAAADNTASNRLLIEIEYTVRATNNQFNLVYPFYLE